jgi:putative hydrolases of HD superfamily
MENNAIIRQILDFLKLSERLKFELRHSWLSSGRQESVAEHSWQMALMAILIYPHLEEKVDLEKSLKLVILHDLIEAEAGDVPFFEESQRQMAKAANEQRAIEKIRSLLEPATGADIYDCWQEFEAEETREARFAKALDNLEVQIQHNFASFDTWKEVEYGLVYTKMDGHCRHDTFLKAFCEAVKSDSEEKMRKAGVDTASLRAKLENTAC